MIVSKSHRLSAIAAYSEPRWISARRISSSDVLASWPEAICVAMIRLVIVWSVISTSLSIQVAAGGEDDMWRCGVAVKNITPQEPMWMAGYGGRTGPATGKLSELFAKALVLEDREHNRGVILTLDLVGIDRRLSRRVATAIGERLKLPTQNVLITTSHTHSGPVVGKNLAALHYYQLAKSFQQQIDEYEQALFENCVECAVEAGSRTKPCELAWGTGRADFATNRRENKEADVPNLRAAGQLKGPVDHEVPVLAARDAEGKLVAVMFGYACHSTVLSSNLWSADYPGYAQSELEQRHPGCVALFFAGCGADQNPLPRRTPELAHHYGQRLATAVDSVLLTSTMHVATPRLQCRYAEVALPLADLPTEAQLRTQQSSENRSESTRASMLLEQIASGTPLEPTYPYPVSSWQFGSDLQLIALGGEVVVDYSLRIKSDLSKSDLSSTSWVAGYAHDVMAYIPSRRVLAEGGYEGGGAMVYYGLPAYWSPEIEERIMEGVRALSQTTD